MATPIIDAHAHLVPADMVKILRKDGARYGVEFSGTEEAPKGAARRRAGETISQAADAA